MPPLQYINDPNFPELQSTDQIRIIKAEAFDEGTDKSELTVMNSVATILYNCKPEALRALLDSNVKSVTFAPKQFGMTLKIQRVEDAVRISYLYDIDIAAGRWGANFFEYGLFQRGADLNDCIPYAANQVLTMPKLMRAESEVFSSIRMWAKQKIMENFAAALLYNESWSHKLLESGNI